MNLKTQTFVNDLANESVGNNHSKCAFHSLFTLIDDGPPPILAVSHLFLSAGRRLQLLPR